MSEHIDTIIIGTGQAGLAVGYWLQQRGASFIMLGKEEQIGDVWRKRYDSLTLFTPRGYNSLPGMEMPGDPNGYPGKDEVADYLEAYAARFELPIRLLTEVGSLEKTADGFIVKTNQGHYIGRQVIVATGPFQKPFIPSIANLLPARVVQTHSAAYLNPGQLADGSALVVGAGNSGAQIAVELASSREVYLATGHPLKFLSLELFGRSIFHWFDMLGILHANVESRFGTFLKRRPDPIFGKELPPLIRNKRVQIMSRLTGFVGDEARFSDGSTVQVDNIIWATGFKPDYAFMNIPGALDATGKPVHVQGASPVHGLYYIGLPWQTCRNSALLGGVGADAKRVTDMMMNGTVNSVVL